jgi:hypothetical protein
MKLLKGILGLYFLAKYKKKKIKYKGLSKMYVAGKAMEYAGIWKVIRGKASSKFASAILS